MPVSAHIDRHAIDERGEISAMIEVESAQEILVGLATPRMLRRDQTGDRLKQFANALDWPVVEINFASLPF